MKDVDTDNESDVTLDEDDDGGRRGRDGMGWDCNGLKYLPLIRVRDYPTTFCRA